MMISRKICLSVISIGLIISINMDVKALGQTSSEAFMPEVSVSNELPMPTLDDELLSLNSKDSMITNSERKIWVQQTKNELAQSYGKNVVQVLETYDSIIFVFERLESNALDELKFNSDHIEEVIDMSVVNADILSVMYMKPEAISKVSQASLDAMTTYSTKIELWYSWSGDWVSLDQDTDTNIYDTIDILTMIFPGLFSSVVSVMNYIISHALAGNNNLDGSNPRVKTRSWAQYYYLNKCGFVYNTQFGLWQNWSQVGSRRIFRYSEAWNVTPQGAFINYSYYINEPNSSTYPTNMSRTEKKSSYDMDSYVISKAIEGYEAGYPFIDIYGFGKYKLY